MILRPKFYTAFLYYMAFSVLKEANQNKSKT